jgi:hypothetical protein
VRREKLDQRAIVLEHYRRIGREKDRPAARPRRPGADKCIG